ncbi:C4-dicarboxylate ABC transporter [Betaproteobacteria bacterium]|nr:C4-dicarboxylate ABC transporter [Betaproteobacteria bacterium]
MERRVILACVLAVTALCISGSVASAAEAKYNWKFANPYPAPHVDVLLQKFASKVTEYSNGQIAIRFYPNGQLGTHDETFHGAQEGSIQIAQVTPYVHLIPGGVIWLPWTISSYKEFNLAFELDNGPKGPLAKLMEVAYGEVGLKPLFYRSNGGLGIANRIREVKTPDDFKGMKFRVSGSLAHVRVLENMCKGSGATFETMPAAEVYNALSKGVVDAIWESWLQLITERRGEVLKHFTVLDWGWDYNAIAINKDLWEDLPDDLKKAITKAAEEVQPELSAVEQKKEEDITQQVAKLFPQLTITKLTEEQRDVFRQKADMPAVWNELCAPWFNKVFPGQDMVAKIIKELAEIREQAKK